MEAMRWRRRRRGAAALVLAIGLWFLIGPRQLGGPVAVALVQGTSMEPVYESGDLVVARTATSYDVGDVVVFAVEGGQVIHRIVGDAPDGGFVTRGDNRDRDDHWTPADEHILGRAWFHLPGAGSALGALVTPAATWVLAGAAALSLVGVGRPKRRRRLEEMNVDVVRSRGPRGAGELSLLAAACLVASMATGLVLLRHPEVDTIEPAIASEHRWSAEVAFHHRTDLYPSPHIVDPSDPEMMPLYRDAVDVIEVRLQDRLAVPAGVDAEMDVVAEIVAIDGWRAPLAAPVVASSVAGTRAATIRIPLSAAEMLGEQHARLSGRSGATWSIVVTPAVAMSGQVGTRDVGGEASMELRFPVTAERVLVEPFETAPRSVTIASAVERPARVGVGALSVPLAAAQRAAAGAVALSALTLLLAGAVSAGWIGRGRAGLVDLRLGGAVLRVASLDGLPTALVPLGTLADLRKVAQRQDGVVLRVDLGEGRTRFAVAGADQTYVLDVRGGRSHRQEVADPA